MAPLPPLTPTPPEPKGARVTPRHRLEISDETIRQSDAALIFVKLRRMIASDTQPTDTILGAIAVAAHSLTEGSGAAIAMPRDGVVLCVGRSGETAPELGDRLNLDSGISGECIRTGVIMRCDDASRDLHVDPEVCSQLGLRSIAVVPLRGQNGRVGVLEAFSTETHAFDEAKMEILGRLAGLAEAAWARGEVTETAAAAAVPSEVKETTGEGLEAAPAVSAAVMPVPAMKPETDSAVALDQMREAIALHRESGGLRTWQWAAVAGGIALALGLSIYAWKEWSKPSIPGAGGQSASGAPVRNDAAPGSTGVASSADVVYPAARPVAPVATGAKSGGSIVAHDNVIRRRPPVQASSGSANNQAASSSDDAEPPLIAASGPNPVDLGQALAASPSLPKMGAPVSQGTSGGVLIRKVQPVYPPEARRMHIEGNVVIEAVITEEGQVDNLKLVSGDARLAPAALDAVRKWRYSPYLLNGKPIQKETRITISFIAPQ